MLQLARPILAEFVVAGLEVRGTKFSPPRRASDLLRTCEPEITRLAFDVARRARPVTKAVTTSEAHLNKISAPMGR